MNLAVPWTSSASKTVCEKAGVRNWIAETLTATPIGAGHLVASLQATRMTHAPIATMSPVSSATGMNSLGDMGPRTGCVPAQKRFEGRDAPIDHGDDRLEMDLELPFGERRLEIVLQLALGPELLVHFRLEEVIAAAIRLGMIKRQVRQSEDFVGVDAVVGGERDPDAGSDFDADAVDVVWLGHGRDQPLRKAHRVAGSDGDALDDGELVAAEARGCVAFPHDAGHPGGDRLQQFVADRVPQGVVDALEAIEIEIEQRETARSGVGPRPGIARGAA